MSDHVCRDKDLITKRTSFGTTCGVYVCMVCESVHEVHYKDNVQGHQVQKIVRDGVDVTERNDGTKANTMSVHRGASGRRKTDGAKK